MSAMPEKIWASGSCETAFHSSRPYKTGTPYTRAPTTLDEALRDYAMFGRWCEYMAASFDDFGPHTIGTFVVDWMLWRMDEITVGEFKDFDAYRAFVKEEMGK